MGKSSADRSDLHVEYRYPGLTPGVPETGSLHGNGLGEIARLVYVGALEDGNVVGKEL
jgi:hypothetical protein